MLISCLHDGEQIKITIIFAVSSCEANLWKTYKQSSRTFSLPFFADLKFPTSFQNICNEVAPQTYVWKVFEMLTSCLRCEK